MCQWQLRPAHRHTKVKYLFICPVTLPTEAGQRPRHHPSECVQMFCVGQRHTEAAAEAETLLTALARAAAAAVAFAPAAAEAAEAAAPGQDTTLGYGLIDKLSTFCTSRLCASCTAEFVCRVHILWYVHLQQR